MAEAVVGQLLVMLGAALAKEAATFGGALLCKEAAALRGLFGKIRDSKAELESMQAYLQEAERFKDTVGEWENVYRALDSQLVKVVIPDAHMILKVSLEDLPYGLKNCFLLCALFPEDYAFKRRTIMRHWIAAGFIREKENRTLEQVAEGYLIELVNRSLLQVVKRNHTGRLKHCRMHDVIRLLALNKAKEECFGDVNSGSAAGAFSVEDARRISIHGENLEQLSRSGATHLCALHVFEWYSNVDFLKPILTSSNFLLTLDLQGSRIKILPTEVFNLFNLRYLGLRYTEVESLPEAVGRLQNLEVLDAYKAKLTYLPKSVVKLKKLRYLYACTDPSGFEAVGIVSFDGVKVPNGIQHLAVLRALQRVKACLLLLHALAAYSPANLQLLLNGRMFIGLWIHSW